MARRKRYLIKRNRFFVVLAFCFAVYLGVVLVQQELKMMELKQEAQQVQQHAQALNKEITQLKDDLASSQSMDYIERQAREKLRMVKPDEIVFSIQGSSKTVQKP